MWRGDIRGRDRLPGHGKNLFKFIFKYTRRQQIYIICVTAAALPFYYSSLDIPKKNR